MATSKAKSKAVNPPAPDTNRACLEQWKEDLRKMDNALLISSANVARYTTNKANASSWQAKLKVCWDSAQQTNALILDINQEITSLSEQAARVCTNATCADEALQAIFCLLKKFYDCTDSFNMTLSTVRNKISCMNDDQLNPQNSKILACLEEMADKLNKTIANQKEMLKMVINLVKKANILTAAVCTSRVPNDEESCGLIDIIERFEELFTNVEGEASPNMPDPDSNLPPAASCKANLEPKIKMPLENDDYYTGLETQYNDAKTEFEAVCEQLNTARSEMEAMQSCSISLRNAIDASEKAKSCK